MAAVARALVLGLALAGLQPSASAATGANPIRKVVTLMQNMQKEIEETGKKEKELYDKFMCYCTSNTGELAKAISDGKAAIETLEAKVKSDAAEKSQTEQELKDHKVDRENAAKDLSEATTIRSKEADEFAEMKADSETNIAGMAKAIPALEKGMGGASFVQLPFVANLQKLAERFPFSDDMDRRHVIAFLSQSGDYVPQSGQIVGILKQMKESMEANLASATTDEEAAVKGFADLKASKEEEQKVATKAIETKQVRVGELAVSAVQAQDDLEDTIDEVADSEKFQKTLEEQCGTKEKEWAEREAMRAQEIQAVSEAIGILNDDDALDVFKKAMPSALVQGPTRFLQTATGTASKVHKAAAIIAEAAKKSSHSKMMKLMLFSLASKLKLQAKGKGKGGFDKVMEMVDDMVVLEGKEQADDDKQMPWCNGEFDKTDRETKGEKKEIDALDAEVTKDADEIAAINDEIANLKTEIMELDKAVSEATEQRKDEHEDYVEETQMSGVAVELVGKAKNRLNKFYNPVLYKAPEEKKELTMEEKILEAGSFFAQIRSRTRVQSAVAPPPPPETFGAYEKSSEKSTGVLGLMDMIVKELEDDMKDAEYEEKTAQKDYEDLMADSAETREAKVNSITEKEATKAKVGAKKIDATEKEKVDFKDVEGLEKYEVTLHGECDFIMENFDTRKEARTQEIESLKNAKNVLAGAK